MARRARTRGVVHRDSFGRCSAPNQQHRKSNLAPLAAHRRLEVEPLEMAGRRHQLKEVKEVDIIGVVVNDWEPKLPYAIVNVKRVNDCVCI